MNRKLKISYNAPVTLTFTLICFVVLLVSMLTSGASTSMFFAVYRAPFTDPLSYLRIFTHVLGHSGIEHFIGNAMYILLLGPMLEEKYGGKFLIEMIVVTALITGGIHCLLFANSGLLGASGVVFAFIVLSSFTVFKNGEIPLTFIAVVILFVGQEVYSAIFVQDNVSNLTHIIGGFVGASFGYVHNKK